MFIFDDTLSTDLAKFNLQTNYVNSNTHDKQKFAPFKKTENHIDNDYYRQLQRDDYSGNPTINKLRAPPSKAEHKTDLPNLQKDLKNKVFCNC